MQDAAGPIVAIDVSPREDLRTEWPTSYLCSAFIRSEGGNRLIAVHGMIGAWSRSSRSRFTSSQTSSG